MQELANQFNKRGEELYLKEDYQNSLKQFQNAVHLDPNNYNALNNIGVVYSKLGDYKLAEESFKKAISINYEFAECLNNLGNVSRLMGFQKTAERYLEKSLLLKPNYEGALLNLGLVTEDLGKLKKSLECNQKAFELTENPQYLAHIYYLKRKMCDWTGFRKIDKQLDNKIDTKGETPFINLIRTNDESKNLTCAKVFQALNHKHEIRNKLKKTNLEFRNTEIASQADLGFTRLRVGYISETFRDHPVGNCVYQMFSNHDKRKFEIFAYSYGVDDGSIYRKTVEKNSQFFDIRKMNTQESVDLIKSHKLDVLIDLQGLTKDNRFEILKHHPAKIVVSYLGFPGTSGSDVYDYLITDKTAVPESSKKYYSEKIVYLKRNYQVNSSLPVSKIKYKRSDFSLPEKSFIFASFARSVKIERPMFKTWCEILKEVPDSILWLYLDNAYARENLTKFALQNEVDPRRIIFSDRVETSKYLKRLELVDILLDTSIYSGGATVANAFQMNTPVVSLKGKHYLSRMSASLHNQIGTKQLVAKNHLEYKNIAFKLATNKNYHKKIKSKIIENKHKIFDIKEFIKDFENLILKTCKETN